jgi:nicotinate-nucleotide adenylyltransferase
MAEIRVGLFFGSFNPIHHGHLILANYLINNEVISQVWFVVSPQNPFKKKGDLVNEYTRLHLVQLAIEGNNNMKALDIEFKMGRPSYTIDTLNKLEEQYPRMNFTLILGSDSYDNLERWKSGYEILEKYQIIVYRRAGFNNSDIKSDKTKRIENPIIEISSTAIRTMIKKGLSVKYLLPDCVISEIEQSGLYKN